MSGNKNQPVPLTIADPEPGDFSKSHALQPKAHRLIPGGAHTYAKGDDQFPEQAPGFIEGRLLLFLVPSLFLFVALGLQTIKRKTAGIPALAALLISFCFLIPRWQPLSTSLHRRGSRKRGQPLIMSKSIAPQRTFFLLLLFRRISVAVLS